MNIAAYTYQADLYCPTCIVPELGIELGAIPAETFLNVAATARGIDREAEETFDSGDFPKVAFADQLRLYPEYPNYSEGGDETADRCGRCHQLLGEGS